MAPQEQNEGIPFGVLGGTVPVIAYANDGVGLKFPDRNPAHAHPDWYQRDLDDEFEDPDTEPVDPLPTVRHRQVPGMS